MTSSVESESAQAELGIARDEMDWDAYAQHYDLMCEFNPSYQENISSLLSFLRNCPLPDGAVICDLGAGTGNYTLAIAKEFPKSRFIHVDFDARMNELAANKYRANQVDSVKIVEEYAQSVDFPANAFDLVLCVNALYAISPQLALLRKIHTWLKPSGQFFVIDFGRKQRSIDWAMYLLRESIKRGRVGRYFKAVVEGREVFRQNRRSAKGQASGRYWLHSTDDFGETLAGTGFIVERLESCYRGYADLAICRKSIAADSFEIAAADGAV